MARVFRAMERDDDGWPKVGPSASALGVRPGIDIDVDAQNNAVPNKKGMSVSPSWQELPVRRKPRRLGGQGSNNTYCFRFGTGPFQHSAFGPGLEFLPDRPTHGVVRPTQLVPLAEYEANLAATRAEWQFDENEI